VVQHGHSCNSAIRALVQQRLRLAAAPPELARGQLAGAALAPGRGQLAGAALAPDSSASRSARSALRFSPMARSSSARSLGR